MRKRRFFNYRLPLHMFFIIVAAMCIVPFLLIVGISFSSEDDILRYGFSLIPKTPTLDAYNFLFKNPDNLINSYIVTIIYAIVGSFVSVIMMSMIGYALSRDNYVLKKPITIFLAITMFFGGGVTPSYIINTQVFHLGDTIWIYLVSGLVSAYAIFVFRAFFSQIPKSLIESACIDGAKEWHILFRIVVPLSLPVMATFGFMGLISRWNDFNVSMYYITDPKLYSLQYLMQQVLNEAKFLAELKSNMPQYASVLAPSETLKFALCIVAAGPALFIFPFFQKYFTKGMMIGSIKG